MKRVIDRCTPPCPRALAGWVRAGRGSHGPARSSRSGVCLQQDYVYIYIYIYIYIIHICHIHIYIYIYTHIIYVYSSLLARRRVPPAGRLSLALHVPICKMHWTFDLTVKWKDSHVKWNDMFLKSPAIGPTPALPLATATHDTRSWKATYLDPPPANKMIAASFSWRYTSQQMIVTNLMSSYVFDRVRLPSMAS